ncbi:MAG TPA: hypothetical protein VGN76_00285 [Gemmatimonadales bacterium]|nr:hypothetical protein [Gemmatimonadales bacterium]
MSKFTSHVIDHIELYLVGFSVAVALALPFAIEVGTNDQELAVTALAACVVQGFVFWALRRRFRRVRLEMIAELRAMLKDRINNQLTIVLMSVTQRRDSRVSEAERELLQAAISATVAISRVLDELSMESLTGWKAKYRTEVATPRPPEGRFNGGGAVGEVSSRESGATRTEVTRQS